MITLSILLASECSEQISFPLLSLTELDDISLGEFVFPLPSDDFDQWVESTKGRRGLRLIPRQHCLKNTSGVRLWAAVKLTQFSTSRKNPGRSSGEVICGSTYKE